MCQLREQVVAMRDGVGDGVGDTTKTTVSVSPASTSVWTTLDAAGLVVPTDGQRRQSLASVGNESSFLGGRDAACHDDQRCSTPSPGDDVDEPPLPLPTIIANDDDERRLRRPLLAEASAAWRRSRPLVRRYLCACFQAPGSHPDFVERVRRSRVALESCESDDRALAISGVVRVANVAYRKTVAARVTTDGWTTQTDVAADYVPRSNDGTTDRFAFQIVLPRGAGAVGRRVEFAVYFTALFDGDDRSQTYWDNNFGANYCFEYYACDDGGTLSLDADADNDDSQFATWLRFV